MMLKILLKYKIAKIVSMQDSFFETSVLHKKIKLNDDLIKLNYEKLSPFKNPQIITFEDKNILYIWFFKEKKSDYLFLVPESFLVYIALRSAQDGVYVFDTSPKKVFVIKKGKLLSSLITFKENESFINILKEEYFVKDHINYSSDDYQNIIQKSTNNIRISELFSFLRLSFKKEDIKDFILDKLTYPIVSLMILYMVVSYTQSYIMQKDINNLLKTYDSLKTKNITIKRAIREHNKKIKEYKEFIHNELNYEDPYKIVYDMYKVITRKDNTIIKDISISGNSMVLTILTKDNPIKYLNRLNKMVYFKNVVIQNTFRSRRKKNLKVITYVIELRSYS